MGRHWEQQELQDCLQGSLIEESEMRIEISYQEIDQYKQPLERLNVTKRAPPQFSDEVIRKISAYFDLKNISYIIIDKTKGVGDISKSSQTKCRWIGEYRMEHLSNLNSSN